MACEQPWQRGPPIRKMPIGTASCSVLRRRFLTNAREYLAVSSNQPDSLRAGGVRRVASAAIQSSPRSRCSKAFANPREGGTCASMLPGFRFLFAAIVVVDVGPGVRARRGGVAARRPRGIRQHAVLAADARNRYLRRQIEATPAGDRDVTRRRCLHGHGKGRDQGCWSRAAGAMPLRSRVNSPRHNPTSTKPLRCSRPSHAPSEATKPQAAVLQNPVPENPPQAEATQAIENQPKVATTEQRSADGASTKALRKPRPRSPSGPATASETAPSPAAEAAPVAPEPSSAPRAAPAML